MAELALDEIENSIMGDIAGGGDDEMVGGEPFVEAVAQAIAIELLDGFGSAENGAAKWVLGPEAAGENFVEEIFGIVQVHLDFFEDDLTLFFDVFRVELRTED